MATSPPSVRLVVRVGVTGHRPNRLDPSRLPALERQIAEVLDRVRALAAAAQAATDAGYGADPPRLRIVSPLAEGADRMVAEAGLALGADLHCPLPFHREAYERDFATPESRTAFRDLLGRATAVLELNGSRAAPRAAYAAAGRVVIQQSDVLLAVWNGAPAAGQGGTAQVVAEAVAGGVPVVWIDPDADRPVCLRGFDAAGRPVAEPLDGLADRLDAVLRPPPAPAGRGGDLRAVYFRERPPTRATLALDSLYLPFQNLLLGERPRGVTLRVADFAATARARWAKDLDRTAGDGSGGLPAAIKPPLLDRLSPHYGWASGLARHYSGLYRSSTLLNYLLGVLAVVFALLGVGLAPAPGLADHAAALAQADHGAASGAAHGGHAIGPAIEFALILIILVNTWIGQRRRWHERWVDYRHLAEQLRQLRFLALLGRATPAPRLPSHLAADDPGHTWVHWLFRAIVREVGLLGVRVDDAYLDAVRRHLAEVELAGQIRYHHDNDRRMHLMKHRLHRWGETLFILTLFGCIGHFFYEGAGSQWLTVCAAVFPACGAALYGIRSQGEFDRIGERSRAMTRELAALRQALAVPEGGAARLDQARLEQIAERAAEVMLAEATDWRFIFRSRPLALPA